VGHPLPSFYDEIKGFEEEFFLWEMQPSHGSSDGEGIYYAIRSGMLAAESILESKKTGPPPHQNSYQEASMTRSAKT